MLRTICLPFLVSFFAFQHHFVAAEVETEELSRVKEHAEEVLRSLTKMRLMDKFDSYLEVHLLMVDTISREYAPLLSEIKERSKRQDMRTIRQSARCLSTAEKKTSEVSRHFYLNDIAACAKLFIDKYKEVSSRVLELSHESSESAGQLHLISEKCQSDDDEVACVKNGTRAAQEKFEMLENSVKSLKAELTTVIQDILKKVVPCFKDVGPLLKAKLAEAKKEFDYCIGV